MDGPDLSGIAASITSQISSLDAITWSQIAVLVVALILCAIASSAETALNSVSRIKLKNLVEEGNKQAIEVDHLLSEPNIYLTAILIVNSVGLVVAAGVSTILALRFTGSVGQFISLFIVSLVVLIFCEITPKTAAVQSPLRWAFLMIGPIRAAAWILRPIIWILGILTTLLARLLGGQIKHRGPFVTEEELRLLVSVSEEEGILEEEETEMIHSIFEFADTPVREVMIPRIDMVTLESDATVDEAVDLALQGGFSRIPVYEENVDNILGILYTKDMLRKLREGNNKLPIRNLVRKAYFVPETKKLDDLLSEIRQNRVHIAMVVDEYGSVVGLVTIEDLVEEIVGDIQDEYDREEKLYERVSEKEYIFNAKISINDFNALMYLDLDDRDYETLGGFLYAQLDKIPVVDDSITYNQMRFTVLTTRGRRITRIRVELESGALPPVESPDANLDEHEHTSDPQNIAPVRPREEQGQATTGSQRQLFARRRSRRTHAKHVGNVSFS